MNKKHFISVHKKILFFHVVIIIPFNCLHFPLAFFKFFFLSPSNSMSLCVCIVVLYDHALHEFKMVRVCEFTKMNEGRDVTICNQCYCISCKHLNEWKKKLREMKSNYERTKIKQHQPNSDFDFGIMCVSLQNAQASK